MPQTMETELQTCGQHLEELKEREGQLSKENVQTVMVSELPSVSRMFLDLQRQVSHCGESWCACYGQQFSIDGLQVGWIFCNQMPNESLTDLSESV